MNSYVALSALAMLAAVGCASNTDACIEGTERCACYPNLTCNDGLSCISKVCVNPGTGGSIGPQGTGGNAGAGGGAGGASGTATSSRSTQPPPSANCADVGIATTTSISGSSGGTYITVDGNPNKTYYMQANWWGRYESQAETMDGIGFSMNNPTGAVSSNNNPMGYPSIFIGSYAGHTTKGSNLPKQVSGLTGVPTVLLTNADTMGMSNYNVSYDVWFTASASPLSSTQYNPGTGGAYLMVWFFMPSDRQPRGKIVASGRTISGVSGSWDVWYDNSSDPPCVSYVSTRKLSQLDYDLNNFIQDSVTNRYGVTSSMYLSIVFAGFEVWAGGSGLQAKAFCANVK